MKKTTALLLSACVAAAGIMFTTLGRAASVSGALTIKGELRIRETHAARDPYVKEWNGFIEPNAPALEVERELTVVLVGPQGTKDAALASVSNGQLNPTTIVMQQGTSLRIRNEDDFTHRLYSPTLKPFDAIETSSGQSRQLQIDEPGAFEIRDKLAPHVRGTLIVLPKLTRAFAPKADGKFAQGELGAGSYQLKVFCRGKEIGAHTLELTEGRDLELEPIEVDVAGLE